MRKLIVALLVILAAVPFVALVVGRVLVGRDGMLLFFPALTYASMAVGPMLLALLVATGRGSPSSSIKRFRQVCSGLLVVAAFLVPWWWPSMAKLRYALENRRNVAELRQTCREKAEDVVYRRVAGVHALGIRLPRDGSLRDYREPRFFETPLHSRDTIDVTWQSPALGNARFDEVILEISQPKPYGLQLYLPAQAPQLYAGQHVDGNRVLPRYELSWDLIQTAAEQRIGLVGVRSTIRDTTAGDVLAQRTTYFLTRDRGPIVVGEVVAMYDGCDNVVRRQANGSIVFNDNSFDWVRSVLTP